MHSDFATSPMSTTLPIAGPLTLGELLDRAFRLYRRRFRTFFLIAGVFYLPYSLVAGLVTGSQLFSMMSTLREVMRAPSDQAFTQIEAFDNFGLRYPLLLVLIPVLGWLLVVFASLALTSQALVTLRGGNENVGGSLRSAMRRYWPAFRMQLWRGLAFFGLIVVVIIVFALVQGLLIVAAGGASALASGASDVLAVIATVGMLALLFCMPICGSVILGLPILYVSARWMVALPGILDQQWQGRESLRGSWRLSRGAGFRCSGYLALLWFLSAVITVLPITYLQIFVSLVLPSSASLAVAALSSVFAALLSMLWQPLYAIAIVLLYFDLRVRREGLDITLRVEQMEAEMRGEASTQSEIQATG